MSDYFGVLMQSSGLCVDADATSRLGTTRQVTPSPADYGIVEVEEQVNHVHNKPSAYPIMSLEPVQDQTDLATVGEAAWPSSRVAPTSSAIEKAISVPVAPMSEADATSWPDSPVADRHATNEDPRRASESSDFPDPEAPTAGPNVVQAALRWIASGESPTQDVPESATMISPQFGSSVLSKEVRTRARTETSAGKRAIEERLEFSSPSSSVPPLRTQAVEAPVTLRDSPQHQQGPAKNPGYEDVIEVTIGSINVRVDAPRPSPLAVAAPSPTPRNAPESPPRLGLSRRMLWRV